MNILKRFFQKAPVKNCHDKDHSKYNVVMILENELARLIVERSNLQEQELSRRTNMEINRLNRSIEDILKEIVSIEEL